jgi:hypothetical protein
VTGRFGELLVRDGSGWHLAQLTGNGGPQTKLAVNDDPPNCTQDSRQDQARLAGCPRQWWGTYPPDQVDQKGD